MPFILTWQNDWLKGAPIVRFPQLLWSIDYFPFKIRIASGQWPGGIALILPSMTAVLYSSEYELAAGLYH